MARHQLPDPGKHRSVVAREAEREVLGQQGLVECRRHGWMPQQRLYLGGEDEQLAVPEVVERLDAQSIASRKEPATRAVPDRKRKHAAEPADAIDAMFLVRMDDGLGIRSTDVSVAGRF